MLAQLEELHADELRVVFRHFPLLGVHDKASLAGQGAEAAGAQGAFWEMHDRLFERYEEWIELTPAAFQDWLIAQAEDLGLNSIQFGEDLESGRYDQTMSSAYQSGIASGLPGTPFIFVNGKWFRPDPSLFNLEASIRLEVLATRQYTDFPLSDLEPDRVYLAHLVLESGDIVLQLYAESAPKAVSSFIFLSEEGWFDDNAFFSIQSGVLVESGDPTGTGFGGPGYHFEEEIDPSLSFDQAGMVALTSRGPGTNGSQFFINLAPLSELNGSRTIFGRVVEGLEILNVLSERDPSVDLLTPAEAVIQEVWIEIR